MYITIVKAVSQNSFYVLVMSLKLPSKFVDKVFEARYTGSEAFFSSYPVYKLGAGGASLVGIASKYFPVIELALNQSLSRGGSIQRFGKAK